MNNSKPKLILHFDINKTIVMIDSASGRGSEEALVADIIAGMSWGKVEQRENNGVTVNVWKCMSDTLSVTSPAKGLITYRYIFFPYSLGNSLLMNFH